MRFKRSGSIHPHHRSKASRLRVIKNRSLTRSRSRSARADASAGASLLMLFHDRVQNGRRDGRCQLGNRRVRGFWRRGCSWSSIHRRSQWSSLAAPTRHPEGSSCPVRVVISDSAA